LSKRLKFIFKQLAPLVDTMAKAVPGERYYSRSKNDLLAFIKTDEAARALLRGAGRI
jgi:hypothetical protein